jgi:hypothetical protein
MGRYGLATYGEANYGNSGQTASSLYGSALYGVSLYGSDPVGPPDPVAWAPVMPLSFIWNDEGPLITAYGTPIIPGESNEDDIILPTRGNVEDLTTSTWWMENSAGDDDAPPPSFNVNYLHRSRRARVVGLPSEFPEDVSNPVLRFRGTISTNDVTGFGYNMRAFWLGLARPGEVTFNNSGWAYFRMRLNRIFVAGNIGPGPTPPGSWNTGGTNPYQFDIHASLDISNWTHELDFLVSVATVAAFDEGDEGTVVYDQVAYNVKDLQIDLLSEGTPPPPPPPPPPPDPPTFAIGWEANGKRRFESGLDRGVLYLPTGQGVPWNGLVSVDENDATTSQPVYFDGRKVADILTYGEFTGSISAFTYPEIFDTLQGFTELNQGVRLTEQPHHRFSVSYRTLVGNDTTGQDLGYKIHIIYNLLATPSGRSYQTLTDTPEPNVFQWDVTSVPFVIPGARPTSRIIIDSTKVDPDLLEQIEFMLYGHGDQVPMLMSMPDLITYLRNWFRFSVTDNGDGTWTADTDYLDYISIDDPEEGQITFTNVNATMLDANTYTISST